MNRIAFGLAALAVALALVFLPPAFVNAQERPTCSPTVSEVIVAMGLVRFDCIVTPPVRLGTAAQVVEH